MVTLNYKIKHIRKHHTTRTGIKLLRVQAVVDHWTANAGGTADNHFAYFDMHLPDVNDTLPENKKRYASAHIFVDKDKALELVPLDEVCFHANDRKPGPLLSTLNATSPQYKSGNANLLTIGVEMCVEKDGTIHPDTLKRTALVHQMLQEKFPQLKDTYNRFVRHYDVTGKNCPAPMVTRASRYKELLDMTHDKVEVKPEAPKPPKEEEPFMLDKAIVYNSTSDFPVVESLINLTGAPAYTRRKAEALGRVAKEVIIVGGGKGKLQADKFTDLSGADKFATVAKVAKYLGK
ncbi:peptidoglycan recognition protein family protein [Sutcliffiella halmapala]